MINEFDEFSATGVIGMPDFATAEKGEEVSLTRRLRGVGAVSDEFGKWIPDASTRIGNDRFPLRNASKPDMDLGQRSGRARTLFG